MVRPECGANQMKARIHPALKQKFHTFGICYILDTFQLYKRPVIYYIQNKWKESKWKENVGFLAYELHLILGQPLP